MVPETKLARVLGGLGPVGTSRFVRNLNRYNDAHSRTVDIGNFIRSHVIPQTLAPRSGLRRTIGLSDNGIRAFDFWFSGLEWHQVPDLVSSHTFEAVQPVPDEGLMKLQMRLDNCGTYLLFRKYFGDNPDIRLAGANFCDVHLLCPMCAIRRSARASQNLAQKLMVVMADNPRLVPAMLTLTVKNGDDLQERFAHLEKSWKKYQQRRRDDIRRKKTNSELSAVQGCVFSYELTRSESGWHPHVHAIVLLDRFIDREKLSSEWREITGDSFIVDIRKLYAKKSVQPDLVDHVPGDSIPSEVIAACCETMKYALKFNSLSLEQNWDAYRALKGRRLRNSFGLLRGVKIEGDLNLLDDLQPDEIPYIDYVFSWLGGHYAVTEMREDVSIPD